MPRSQFVLITAVFLCLLPAVDSVAQQGQPRAQPALPPLAPPAAPAGLSEGDRDKDVDARVGALVAAFARRGPFSGVVVVAREGKVIAARVAGWADVEHASPMRLDTPMRIASVTKPLTAAAVLALRERGLVGLDAPIGRYLPDAPAAWSKVTVRHLLSQRSGLGEYAEGPGYDARQHRPATTSELMKAVAAVPPRAKSGGEFDYCNSNYVVLGALIERVTRHPYDAAMRRLVFQPLGMTSTAVDGSVELVPGRAVGYRYTGRLEHAAPLDPSNAGASGGLRSTPGDLVRFAHALSRGGLLKDESRREMFAGEAGGYGLGFFIGAPGAHRMVEHSGGFDGFSSYLGILPDADLCAIVLCNVEHTRTVQFGRALLRAGAGEAVGDDEIPEPVDYVPPPRIVTAQELGRYAGEYRSELGVLKFAVDGQRLTLHGPGDPKPEPLTAGDQPGTFQVLGPSQVRLRFRNNGEEPSETVELSIRGKVIVGTRSN